MTTDVLYHTTTASTAATMVLSHSAADYDELRFLCREVNNSDYIYEQDYTGEAITEALGSGSVVIAPVFYGSSYYAYYSFTNNTTLTKVSASDNFYVSDIIGVKYMNGTIGGDASDISYDNTGSGLTADDVQEAIDELNSKLVNLPSVSLATYVTAEVVNGQLIFSCENHTPATLNAWVTIGTLPTGYRPTKNLYFTGLASNMTPCLFYIGTNGTVQIRAASSQAFAASFCAPVATS